MTFDTLKLLLEPSNFQPLRVVLNSGQVYEVKHPEFVVLTEAGSLFIFKPSEGAEAYTAKDIRAVVALRNIASAAPLAPQAA